MARLLRPRKKCDDMLLFFEGEVLVEVLNEVALRPDTSVANLWGEPLVLVKGSQQVDD